MIIRMIFKLKSISHSFRYPLKIQCYAIHAHFSDYATMHANAKQLFLQLYHHQSCVHVISSFLLPKKSQQNIHFIVMICSLSLGSFRKENDLIKVIFLQLTTLIQFPSEWVTGSHTNTNKNHSKPIFSKTTSVRVVTAVIFFSIWSLHVLSSVVIDDVRLYLRSPPPPLKWYYYYCVVVV